MKKHIQSRGQAMITVLFISIIGLLIATGAITAYMTNMQATSDQEVGALAYGAAESGIENGMVRLLRDPTYAGETIPLDATRQAVVTVSSGPPITITSVGSSPNAVKTITVTVHYTNLTLVIDSWQQSP